MFSVPCVMTVTLMLEEFCSPVRPVARYDMNFVAPLRAHAILLGAYMSVRAADGVGDPALAPSTAPSLLPFRPPREIHCRTRRSEVAFGVSRARATRVG